MKVGGGTILRLLQQPQHQGLSRNDANCCSQHCISNMCTLPTILAAKHGISTPIEFAQSPAWAGVPPTEGLDGRAMQSGCCSTLSVWLPPPPPRLQDRTCFDRHLLHPLQSLCSQWGLLRVLEAARRRKEGSESHGLCSHVDDMKSPFLAVPGTKLDYAPDGQFSESFVVC